MSTGTDIRNWETVLVYGLGVSGRAAASLAVTRGQRVVAIDDDARLDADGLPDAVDLRLGEAELPAVDGVVVSPGVSPGAVLVQQAVESGVQVLAEVEFAWQWSDRGTFVGITGSNGKSTTTALTGEILEADGRQVAVCGNFGLALSAAVEKGAEVYVVELSSFQLERVDRFHCSVATWLNLSADHLDRHGSLTAYAATKERVFRNQTGDDVAVLNLDDAVVSTTRVDAGRKWFSSIRPVTSGCYLEQDLVLEVDNGESRPLFGLDDLSLPGRHNLENAMAAALIGRSFDVSAATIRQALSDFRGLPHRLELVAEVDGVRYFNDSKGTNPAAAARSLASFPGERVHLIVGGRAKGGDWADLITAARGRVRRVYGIGEAGPEVAKALSVVASASEVLDLEGAVSAATAEAHPGDVVLLSPACASYDQYRNFEQRGDHFRELVRRLTGGSDG